MLGEYGGGAWSSAALSGWDVREVSSGEDPRSAHIEEVVDVWLLSKRTSSKIEAIGLAGKWVGR